MSLDDLERQLYARSFDAAKRVRGGTKLPDTPPDDTSASTPPPSSVREQWNEEAAESGKPPLSFTKKLLFVVLGLVVVGLVGGGIVYFALSNRVEGDVTVSIDGSDRLYRGVPFEIVVGVSNQREAVLRSATLSLTLPPGLISVGGVGSVGALVSEPIGDVGTGILTQKTFKLLPIGDVRSVQNIVANLSYSLGGRGRFEVSESREVFIEQSAISLEVKQLDKVLSGSTFTVEEEYTNL